MDGTLHRDGDVFVIRFERTLAHPIDRVWVALTERDRLAEWLGEVDLEPEPGGTLRIVFTVVDPPAVLETTVQAIEPPRLLQFRFADGDGDDNIVRFELTSEGDGTRLTLTQSRVPSERDLIDNAAGWHMRIDMLDASLDHGMQELSWSTVERYTVRYAALANALSQATP